MVNVYDFCYNEITNFLGGSIMAAIKTISLSDSDRKYLQSLVRQRTLQAQIVDRAKILLYKEQGDSYETIANRLDLNLKSVKLCIDKYLEGGVERALSDDSRTGRPIEITDDAKAWIISVACQKPCDLGYAAELWSITSLHKHIQNHAEDAGYPRLKTVTKSWLQKYLKSIDIKPFKIKYYLERKDPDFEEKMHNVLLVYKQVEMQFDENGSITIPEDVPMTHTLSYDEKPGIQAVANKYPDHNPTMENGVVRRDYEYVRLGTLSLLAGIDLLTGEAIPLVSESHKSSDFINFLQLINEKYPKGDTIRLILDNHSAHKSKETKRFLAGLPEERFEFVFTPTHTSWLNMIESFFSKMTRQMLKGIRVNSKEELAERIYLYFKEINAEPVVYHWTYKMDEIDPDEAANI